MKGNKGFTNRAKGGDKALAARWKRESVRATLERAAGKPRRRGMGLSRKKG